MSHLLSVSNSIPEENDDKHNFFVKENNAYTEDNVLIYNIFVYTIPKQFVEDDVRRYFSKFGKVLDVKLVTDKKRSRRAAPKVGFVNFSEPESACSALQKNNHRLQGFRICVKAGDSWNQPNADKVCGFTKIEDDVASTSRNSSENGTAVNSSTHMLSLNDDCIETIFGYLKLKEQVRFARVCERLQCIFQIFCKRQYKNFDLSNFCDMTLWEIRDFFRFTGGNMGSITGTVPYKNRERIMEFLRTFCGNLKRIQLDDSKMRNECLKKLFRGYPQLQELALRNCSLNDFSIQTMTPLNQLETLELAENYELTGKYISKLVQLKVLNIYGCCNIQTSNLVDMCKSLINLRSLDIRQCERLSETLFDTMVDHCKELEILKISSPGFQYERIALLPRLTQLELLSHSLHGTSLKRMLAELVAHKADQLEVLKIIAKNALSAEHIALISKLRQLKTLFVANNQLVNDDALIRFCNLQQLEELTIKSCSNITNLALLKLVKSCQRLHHLNIQFCKHISIEFLLETISFLKASEKRKKPLVLITYGTALDYYIATEYDELKEAEEQSLISVVFHASNLDIALKEDEDMYDIWDDEQWNDDDSTDNDEDDYLPERDMMDNDDDLEFNYEILAQILNDEDDDDIEEILW